MSLNTKLMQQYKSETGKEATYQKEGATYHFLDYVDWLEDRASETAESCQLPTTQDKTPAAPTPEGEITPTWCKAKVCEYTWRKCEEELCCFDRSWK